MSSRNVERPQPKPAPRGPNGPWSLARRLTVWYLVYLFTLGCMVTAFYYWGLNQGFANVDDDLLREKIQELGTLLMKGKARYAQLEWEVESASETPQSRHLYMRILDESGKPFLQTPGMADFLPTGAFPAATGSVGQGSFRVRGPSGRVFDVMAASATGSRGTERWVVQVAYDRTSLVTALKKHESMMAVVLAVVSLAALGLGHRIVRRGLRPLLAMVDATREIHSSTLSQRLNLEDLPAELASLAQNFNEMLDRLDKSFQQISRFSADIAHELRTPLTNLRGEAEVALSKERPAAQYREVLVSSLEEYAHISGIIDSLLFLALAERSDGDLERESVNVREELGSIAGFFEPMATEQNLRIELAVSGDLRMNLNRVLVRRALSNLVSNALAHTPPGGIIGLAAYRQEASIRVIVSDNGAGIPAEHLPHLFDRFYRVDESRSRQAGGTGAQESATIIGRHSASPALCSAGPNGLLGGTESASMYSIA